MSVTIELPGALQARAEALAAERGMEVEALLAELLADSLVAYTTGLPTRERRAQTFNERMRAYCAAHGQNWDEMDDEARDVLISRLVEEGPHAGGVLTSH